MDETYRRRKSDNAVTVQSQQASNRNGAEVERARYTP